MPFRWNPLNARYQDVDTGQFYPRSGVLAEVTGSISSSGVAVTNLASQYANGEITAEQWRTAMRDEVKGEYIRQYEMGRGGRNAMTQRDWGSVGAMLREQYRYLDRFAGDIEEMSEAAIAARSRMYANSAREAFSRADVNVHKFAGYNFVRWIVNAAIENCEGCLAFAAMGVQPVTPWPYKNGGRNCYPGSGCTPCLTNCGCSMEYIK